MSKSEQDKVDDQFRGYHKGYDYEKAMKKAIAQDRASHASVPVQRNAAVDAWFDQHCSCTGCCGHDEHNPENNSSCCTIL